MSEEKEIRKCEVCGKEYNFYDKRWYMQKGCSIECNRKISEQSRKKLNRRKKMGVKDQKFFDTACLLELCSIVIVAIVIIAILIFLTA